MDFARINEKGEAVKIPVRVSTSDDHQEIYAHGAIGAALANYHFRIDFYRDTFPPMEYEVIGNEIQGDGPPTIERKILTSVYVPLPFLKELQAWLERNIATLEQQYGSIVIPDSLASDTDSPNTVPKVKEA